MQPFRELIVPGGYTSSTRLLDIHLSRLLLALVGSGRAGSSDRRLHLLERLTPSDCTILGLPPVLPPIRLALPILLGLDNRLADRLIGSSLYQAWMKGVIRHLVGSGQILPESRHVVLRPFMRSFRPESRLVENLEQLVIFYRLTAWQDSTLNLSAYVNQLCDELAIPGTAQTRTGDLDLDSVEKVSLFLLGSQPNLVFSFHSRTLHYLELLQPVLWVAPVSLIRAFPSAIGELIVLEECDLLSYVISFRHRLASSDVDRDSDLFDDEMDEEDDLVDNESFEGRLPSVPQSVSGHSDRRLRAGTAQLRNRFGDLAKGCPELFPDRNWTADVISYSPQFFRELCAQHRLSECTDLLIVFLPKPAKRAVRGSVWMRLVPVDLLDDVTLVINPDLIDCCGCSSADSRGWGQVFVCRVSDLADPLLLYHEAHACPEILSTVLLHPLALIARVNGYVFREQQIQSDMS
jgi:hypothetical protein